MEMEPIGIRLMSSMWQSELTIETPQASRNFTMANNFPNGMGYFSNFSRPSAGNNILSGNEISSL